MRPYRARYAAGGQASPVVLANEVAPHLRGESLADVGCGSGIFGYIFRATGQVKYIIGIDFSASAVDRLRSCQIYDEVYVADSAGLPLLDHRVDASLSMENLEHLYPVHVRAALAELVRIAREQVIVTTPAPWDAINRGFLSEELSAAKADVDPMPYDEFAMLASYLHVSWLSPEQMRAAGFSFDMNRMGAPRPSCGSMIYWADPQRVNLNKLGEVSGLLREGVPPDDGRGDWRGAYVELLEEISSVNTPRAPRSLDLLQSGATVMTGLKGLARLGRPF